MKKIPITNRATALERLRSPEAKKIYEKYHVTKVELFGSFARDEMTKKSDIDLRIEIKPVSGVGLFEYWEMIDELKKFSGKKVNAITLDYSPNADILRPYIQNDLTPIY